MANATPIGESLSSTPKLITPKIQPYLTIIPSRRPKQKLHSTRGHAKLAIVNAVQCNGYWGQVKRSPSDIEAFEWKDGEWAPLWSLPQGEFDVYPWEQEDAK